jgi:ATP-dependent RNA circularization protein (DNA/RNA ligase family)
LKEKLLAEPIIGHPNFNKKFKLYTDASDIGLGAVLAQDDKEGREKVIGYAARTLNNAEKNYPVTEKECLAVVWGTQKFKQFLGGKHKFTIYTDHAVLKTLMTHENPSPRRVRWLKKLAYFDFDIEYRPGKRMEHANYLSRLEQPKDINMIRKDEDP